MKEDKIRLFQARIFHWWEKNKRAFPWRETTDPYKIMVSEFMLQQTQANRVIDKYLLFTQRFPSIESLAQAKTSEVIKAWSGLGYNRRAIWLQEATQAIMNKGYFPKDPTELKQLRGIGDYTSKSILIFAFNMDLAAVDTNIRRILIHEGFATTETNNKELQAIAIKILPKGKARDWHNALMDYGSVSLTSRKTRIKPKHRQPRFQGSTREARGLILKAVIKHESINVIQAMNIIQRPMQATREIIEKMHEENLIVLRADRIFLPE